MHTTYKPLTTHTIKKLPQFKALAPELQRDIRVVSTVFPFRTNPYVVDELIDWDAVPNDPMYQLTFPQRGMLADSDYATIANLIHKKAPRSEVKAAAQQVQMKHNPHPAGQLQYNVPTLDGEPLPGLQHKYPETVLFFPSRGQTCHAYCSYCFRWAQFIGDQDLKFAAKESEPVSYTHLRAHET